MRSRPLAAALLVVPLAAAALTGCSRGAAPAAPVTVTVPAAASPSADDADAADALPSAGVGGPPDACALVTKADAEKLTKIKLTPGQPLPESCQYAAASSSDTAQVSVFVGDGAKKTLDVERSLGHELKAVPGAGDEAWSNALGGYVFVRKGTVWAEVALVLLNDPAENEAPLAAVARTMASRL
ncbi:MAG TPA: hypothetical protein VE781_17425 [Kineosporiaceae bacterium]|jgi:hypothetical protein|nr:hypothetical protein [Kineosporiaceae bacterium]